MQKMLTRISKLLRSGSHNITLHTGIYFNGAGIFIESHEFDNEGNDYVTRITNFSIHEIEDISKFLELIFASIPVCEDRSSEEKEALWHQVVRDMGFRDWQELYSNSKYLIVSEDGEEGLVIYPTLKENGNFVISSEESWIKLSRNYSQLTDLVIELLSNNPRGDTENRGR